MKQILFLLLFGFLAVQVNAQKACCAKDAKIKTEATSVKSAMLEADLIASNDSSIEKRENEETGEVSYFKKVMNESTGATEYQTVVYNGKTKSFVTSDAKVYENGQGATKKACSSKGEADGKACCAKKASKSDASVQSAMMEKEEAPKAKACSSKSSGKACCSKKAKAEKSE